MMISGHKTRSILDRYNIVNERDLKEAAIRLGEFLASKDCALPESQISADARNGLTSGTIQ